MRENGPDESRRRVIRGAGVAAAGFAPLTGCLGEDPSEDVQPVDLSGRFDDEGGMAIGDHGGPNGQVFYSDNSPEGHDNPAWFHTLVFGMFPYHLDRLDEGWEAEAVYVTDYSSVDREVVGSDLGPVMPSYTAPETFGDATSMTYVAESDATGGMGPDLHPFSEEGDAESFVEEYGGRTVGYDAVDRRLLRRLRTSASGGGMDM